jgi:undecaprenyl phosphate-alpha-L-ara4N flippase subunit ArnE
MIWSQYLLLAVTVVLLAAGQIAQKYASRDVDNSRGPANTILSMLTSYQFWIAGILMALALLVWLLTLTVTEVSKAYPVLSMSFVLTAVISKWMLKERISRNRWIGIAFISVGAAIMLTAV